MFNNILSRVEQLGYKVFTNGKYNLNVIGIRKSEGQANIFDDELHLIYKDESGWVDRWWTITTDPGHYYLMSEDKQLNPAGTAILVPGQYRGVYKISRHGKSRYEALCQRNGKVKVWRDGNLDDQVDYGDNEEEGYFGINIHAASSSPYKRDQVKDEVGVWSAGCQVFKSTIDFRSFMKIVRKQTSKAYTYTLLDEW
jgi:hypothetical protein